MNPERIYIIDGLRTPIGSFLGSLKTWTAPELGAAVIRALLEKNRQSGANVDEVIAGNVLSAGAGMGVARQAARGGGLPVEVPAYGINMICGSGLKAIMNAATEIRAGNAGLIIAGGTESMSNAPFILPAQARRGIKMGEIALQDHLILDGLTDAFNRYHMGITAENLAERYGIPREAQDVFALDSQRKAIKALDTGEFRDEVVPLEVQEAKNAFTFDTDEYPNLSRCNVKGGAIALGHPLGASGARIVVTLLHILEKRRARYGLASLCIGGGMGAALILRPCYP